MGERAVGSHLDCCHGKISQLFFNGLEYLESIPVNWKLINVVLGFKKGRQEDHSRPIILTSQQNYGEDYARSYWKTSKRKCSYWSQPMCVHEENILFNRLTLLLWLGHPSSQPRKGSWCDHLDTSKAFNIVSHTILLCKTSSTQLDKNRIWLVNSLQ